MPYQSSASMKYAPLASSNVISLPLLWRNWYLIVVALSLFFTALALITIVHIFLDNIRDDNKSQSDWL